MTRRARTGLLSAVCAVAFVLLALPAAASASFLTFDNYDTGTLITNQYQGDGVLFSGDYETPEITWDESNDTSPVLRGGGDFYEPIHARFVVPSTTTPGTINGFMVDVGYIDDLYSTEVVVHTTHGDETLYLDEYGINAVTSTASGITGFDVQANEEDAGFGIDNLSFTPPAPPPPAPPLPPSPPPTAPTCPRFAVFDSRGSGEPRGEMSNPGKDWLKGFKDRLSSLHSGGQVSVAQNLYPAVGVWSWNPFDPSERLNGFGAFLHSSSIGAYKDSEDEGEGDLKTLIRNQAKSACGKSKKTKMILLGYSQGAEVTGNVYHQISDDQRAQIAAVVLWGDPQYNHTDNDADRDSRDLNGSLGTRKPFPDGKKVFSYCNTHDPICQWMLPYHEMVYYQFKEHRLYWKTDQAKNNGSAVASFLVKGH